MLALEGSRLHAEGFVRCALTLGAIFLFYTSIDMYALLAWSAPAPVRWVFVLLAAAAALVLADPRRPLQLLRSPVGVWAAFFFLSTTLWGIWMEPGPRNVQVLIDRYRSIAFLVALAVVFDHARAHRVAVRAVAAAAVFAACVNIAEFLGLLQFATEVSGVVRVEGRSGGFYVNANDAGNAIVFGLAATLGALPRKARLPLVLIGTAGVAATFSRGSALCLLALLGWLVWRKLVPRSAVALIVLLIAIGVYQSGGIASIASSSFLNENTAQRLLIKTDSNGRLELAARALKLFVAHPLVGAGLGATRAWELDASSHDTYLNLAADQGIVGLLTLPLLLLAMCVANRRAAPLALVMLIGGVFSDGLIDQQRFTLVLVALATAGAVHATEVTEHPAERRA